jgi:hypothetical protein
MSTVSTDECVVCMERPRTHLLLNCCHRCLCAECAKIMFCDLVLIENARTQQRRAGRPSPTWPPPAVLGGPAAGRKCPVCNERVERVVRVWEA